MYIEASIIERTQIKAYTHIINRYDPKKLSVILFKCRDHYEPVQRVQVLNRVVSIYKEFAHHDPVISEISDHKILFEGSF